MACEQFQSINFREATLILIDKCNTILDQYSEAGYDMTLRQLYYQLVATDEIPNSQKEYDKLGVIVNNARLAGLIDWEAIVDRTRSLKGLSHWDKPSDIMDSVAYSYRLDKWATQKYRPEVWIEKDALAGVFQRVCNELDVPYFSCRGYTSQSEMYAASKRFLSYEEDDQTAYIFHFGDHDPSGIDMSRDIQDRLNLFGTSIEFDRLALNMNQVRKYKPPPNPAKIQDTRAHAYIKQFGAQSWELDALPPDTLAALVRNAIMDIIDQDAWDDVEAREDEEKGTLMAIRDSFDDISNYVKVIGKAKRTVDAEEDDEDGQDQG